MGTDVSNPPSLPPPLLPLPPQPPSLLPPLLPSLPQSEEKHKLKIRKTITPPPSEEKHILERSMQTFPQPCEEKDIPPFPQPCEEKDIPPPSEEKHILERSMTITACVIGVALLVAIFFSIVRFYWDLPIQTIQDINNQVIEDPSMKKIIGGQMAQAGEMFVNSVIAAGNLEPPSGVEEDEDLTEQPPIEITSSARRKRKESTPAQGSAAQPEISVESPPPPPLTRSKRLRKRSGVESDETEEPTVNPIEASGTDDELREAFEAVEQEKEQEEEATEAPSKEKGKEFEEEEEIPAEVIAESIALTHEQWVTPRTELTSSELALFEDAEAEHSTAVQTFEEQAGQSVSEPVKQAEPPVVAPAERPSLESGEQAGTSAALEPVEQTETSAAALVPEMEVAAAMVEVSKTAESLTVMVSPLKPLIAAMHIQSLPGSSTTASFADPELAEFEAMDLDAQLDRLEKLSSTPSKAKFKVVDKATERVKIWQSTELERDENRGVVDQLMKDLDLMHRQNMASKPILEISLGLARDVLNLYDRYEDLKPTFKTSELCKATHEANLADYANQKAELDQMVVGYKEAKAVADKLEKQIEELLKQLAERREVQRRLGAGLSSKTKATFLVQSMVSASRPALEVAEASIHQGVLLQKELSIKKTSLQETLKKLGF